MKCRCPARAGILGCPRIHGSVAAAVENGQPIVTDPPADDVAPAVCRNDTVTLRVRTDGEARAMKLAQKHFWGSRPWRRKYARRTFVEGWFGVLESSTSTGLDRGSHAFVGLPLVTLVIAASSGVTNMRLLRSWHAETVLGDLTHPLLVPDEEFHGFAQLDWEQADHIDAHTRQPTSRRPPKQPDHERQRGPTLAGVGPRCCGACVLRGNSLTKSAETR